MPGPTPHIGTLKEKPLHASLKRWYAETGDRMEVPVDGFVIDLVRSDLLIEIQTGGFSSLKQKLSRLLRNGHRIRVVHPIPLDKWIIKLEGDGTILSRRRSPRHGVATDIFSELVSIPELLAHPGLEVEVLLTTEEEYRSHSPGRAWRRKGWVVVERHLVDVIESLLFQDIEDLVDLLPEDLPEHFTTADISERLNRPRRSAQQMAYCLRKADAIVEVGRTGNTIVYQLS